MESNRPVSHDTINYGLFNRFTSGFTAMQQYFTHTPVDPGLRLPLTCLMLHPPSDQFRSRFHKVTATLTNIEEETNRE